MLYVANIKLCYHKPNTYWCPVCDARLQLLDFRLRTFDHEDDVAGLSGPQPVARSEFVNKFRKDVSKINSTGLTTKTVEVDGDSSQEDLRSEERRVGKECPV